MRNKSRQSAVAVVRRACKAAVETLEQRQLLSTTSDGFTASFFGAQYTSVAAFPAPNTNTGDYSTHMDVINMPSGSQGIAPTDAPATFNPNAGANGQGYEFSGLFTTQVVVQQSGFFTFYPTTDDGAQINLDGALAGAANLPAARGPTQDTDAATSEWLAGSTHLVQFYYNNGGGGWAYELRWSESAGAGGSGTSLIPYSLMTGSGAPGVANLEAPTPIVTPPVPTSTGSTTNSISLSWSSHDVDAASYIVERATSLTGTYTPVNAANPVASADGGTDSYLDTGLTRSTTYYYKLVGNSIYGSASVGVSSEPTSAATAGITTPAANSPLATPVVGAVPGSGGNVLTIGQVANATTYNILRSSTLTGTYSQVGAVPYSGSATTLSYTDAGNNADSFYKIQAVDTAVSTTDPGYSTTSNPTTLGSGDGFAANYYNYSFNATPASGATANGFQTGTVYVPPTAPTFQTIIPTINTGGGLAAANRPAPTPSNFNSAQSNGPGADFSIVFDFNIVAPYDEQMTFLPRTDDGYQLTVDGVILGTAPDEGATTHADPVVDSTGKAVVWQAGTTHSVQMDYFQDGGGYEYDLYWTSPSIAALNSNSQTVPVPQYDAYASGSLPNLPVGATLTTPPAAPPPAQPTLHSAAPASPTGFTAAANTQSVNLSFSADAAANYNIYRTTTGPITSTSGLTPITTVTGSPNASPGVATYTYLDTGLTNNTTYYYAVTGVDASGEGLPATLSATPMAVPPSAPTGVVAAPYILTAGTTTVTGSTTTTTQIPQVTISIPTVPFATSYQIQRAPQSTTTPGTPGTFATVPGGTISASSGATTTFTDTDPTLSLGQIYFYQVYAIDSNGRSVSASTPVEVNYGTGVEDHYYNNEYWSSTPQTISSAAGIVAPGTGAAVGSTNEAAFLPIINSSGSDSTTGIISTTGSTGNAEYPDPQGVIGPDNYSDVFTGKITVPVSGAYTFAANTDDDGFLYVDGTLVSSYPGGHGASSNYVNTPITLDAGSYDFDFFQANGGGGWQAHMLWNVSGSGSGATLGTTLSVVPSTAFSPISDVPAAATNVTAGTPTLNSAGNSYSVAVTFTDNSADEVQYLLQRSTDAAFDGNGQVATVASSGLVDNGHPSSSGSTTVPGTGSGTITDSSAPANGTYYYRVVAANYDGSSASAVTAAVTTGAAVSQTGLEVNFFNNEWWRSTDQSTNAIVSGAVGSAASTATLSSDEQTILPDINGSGTDSGTGTLEANGNGAKYPDPQGIIGPDDFSDVFTGQINITTAGSYTFAANTDDDGYLYVDDRLASSYPGGHGNANAEVNYATTLTAGKHDIEFFESNGGGGWAFQMYYSGPDTSNASEIVPSAVLNSLSDPVVAPTTFTASPTAAAGQVTLTWSNNNTSAIRYVIQRSTSPTFSTNVTTFDAGLNGTEADVASYPATSTYTDTGVPADAISYYRIVAQNFDGTSSAATTSVKVPPAPPVGVVALWSGSAVSVTWVADANAVSYNVYRSTTPGGEGATPIATGLTTTSYTDSSVASDLTYYYEITAVDASSLESPRSFETFAETSLPSTVIITELQAVNNTTLADSAGGYPDWLEVYNPTAAAVNLNGYYLTNDASDPTDWEFPSVTLASGAYMIVFCDSASQTNPAQQLHTNFNLSGDGGYVALVGPDGHTVLSSYAFPQQLADGTYGVAMAETTSGGSTITSYGAVGYLNPTPGAPNGNIIGAALTPEPTFNQPGGFYSSSFQLSINDATPGAAIYYTLDGSLPSPTNGTLYTGPITISGQTAMRAVAIGPDDVPSFPNTDTFIYTSQVVTQDANGQPPPGWPSSWGLSIAHYGMNPAVVDSPSYSGEIQSDLLDVPSFSITMNLADLFDPATGIYSNSEDYGGSFTRPASVQYIIPSGAAGFTANVGIAIKGDASASSPDAMHGFRLEFSSTYGEKELDYPLFSTGTDKFEEVDLRCDQNNSWDYQDPQNYIGIRDQFTNATIAAMGEPGQRSQICYLYINGIFWGLYDAIDRTDSNWAANTYGGNEADYDTIKSGGEHNGFTIDATDGTLTAWDELVADMSSLNFSSNANYEMVQGNNPDGTPNPAYADLINVPELIQYMMVIDYTGNLDAPNSTFVGPNNPNNFYAVRPTDGSFGFIFMASDSEWTLLDVNTNRVNSSPSTVTDELATPAFFFQQLETNANFKHLVADDIQKDFFNNGPLSVTAATATFKSLAAEVYGPVVEQSARWGDVMSLPPYVSTAPANPYTYTRDVDWQNEINSMESSYLPQRSGIVLGQLEAVGLYPSVAAPTFSQFGGTVAAGYHLNISNPNSSGSIYYTLDGSDPVTLSGTLSSTAILYTGALTLNTTTEVKAVVLSGSTFSAVTDATFDVPITTVRVTELDYDPPTPLGGAYSSDDDEFIELKNFGTQSVNLDGVSFTNGINYTFGNVSLAPGQVGVLVSNPTAFAALYGNSVNVLGNYQASGTHFSNSGEEVTIVDATGQTMVDFTYSPTWYPTTAGGGPSLEVVDPASNPNLNLAASWQPSPEPGGTPGVDDSIPTGPPTGLVAAITNQQVTLSWSAVAGAASYDIYRGTTSGGEGTTPIAAAVTTTTFTDTTAVGGNTYYYTVAAVDPGGVSTASNEASVVVPITPFAPVIASQPSSQIVNVGGTATFTASASGYPLPTVQWNMSSDGGQTWTPISGAMSPTYSFSVTSAALDGTEYQAVFTNSQGSTPTNVATLTAIAAPFTAWDFDTSDRTGAAIPIATNTSPDPSTGSGTASSIGMALVTGPDTSNILAVNGSSDTGSANQAWRIVGTNGWSSTAPIGTQGAQFITSTTGESNVSVQFDLETTAQGEGNLAVEYTTNGGSTWSLASSLNANGDPGIAVATNTTSPNTVQGEYFDVIGGDLWYNRLTADFNGVAGVANNPNFGIRLVNASTGADCVNSTGQPLDNTSGNWRFDEVDIDGTALPFPLVTTQPISQVGTVGQTVSFTATASGTPTPTVQWQVSTNGGSTWSPISGATSATYSFTVPSALIDGYEYEAVFTNSLGSTTSNPATLTAVGTPFTAWNFDALSTKGTNTSPVPSTGSGTAASIGMALVSGPDASSIVVDAGSSDGGAANTTNQAWRIVGTNGWSSTAPIGSQGAQFLGSTVGYSNISVQFDLNLTAQGEGKLAVEYTTNGGTTWNDATSLNTDGDPGIAVLTNTTSPNTIQGEYFDATGGALWYNRLTADFSNVAGVANNPNFGIRLVNASTGADCVNSTGQPLNNTSGNWRFDEVDINGAANLPAGITASPGAVYNYNPTTNTLSLTSGTLTFNNVGTASSLTLNVTADGAGSNLMFDTTTYLNSLTLTDGATAQLVQSGADTVTGAGAAATLVSYGTTLTQANTKILVLNSLSIPLAGAALSGGGTNSAQGTLDLTNNAMILNYAPGSSAAALAAADTLTGDGSDGGVWDGTGVTSSNAEADNNNNGYTAVGVADNGDLGFNTFAGQNVSSGTQILFMYTYNGDADLNGMLNVTDTISYESGLATHPGGPAGTGWEYGSLDYGATPQGSISDLQLLEAGFRGYRANGAININES